MLATYSSASVPTRLRPADLLRITDQGASEVLDGRHDVLLPQSWPTDERWSTRLYSDDDVDVWLISWVPDRNTELHDHAGSFGALTVLSGALSEFRWAGDQLRHRILDAGDQPRFRSAGSTTWCGRGRTRGTGGDADAERARLLAAIVGHVLLRVTDHGTLRRTRTELTDLPEGGSK